MYRILAINPGSTSTKIAVYDQQKSIFLKNIKHSNEELAPFSSIAEQYPFRRDVIFSELAAADIEMDKISAVIGRGGLVKPIESGIYEVNEALKTDLKLGIQGEHASNLGGLIADDIARNLNNGCKAYIADPVVVDELEEVARISGLPEMPRRSIFHALNQKAVGRLFAKTQGRKYAELNLIIAHMGGGVSVGTHRKGKVIDVNQAITGFGPFSPERSGTLPAGEVIEACFSGKYTQEEMMKKVVGSGGFVAHLGTNQAMEVVQRATSGDTHAKLIMEAMCYQVAKEIGSGAAVLKGEVDGIILTGGIAYNEIMVNYIREMVEFIAPVTVYPGEDEMEALMRITLSALKGEVECKQYGE
ncbi:MAG: butyrate kinase [Mangrovibacterium sp.]